MLQYSDMDLELDRRLVALEAKIDATHLIVMKTYRIFWWTAVVSVVFFVLPLIGIAFVAPSFLTSMTAATSGLQGL